MFGKAQDTPRNMSTNSQKPVNTTQHSTKSWKKPWQYLGFNKGYNVPLFIILAGAMFGFCLAKISCLDVGGKWAAQTAPGEWHWYQSGSYRIGITLHLVTVLPAGLLMVWQFIPAIRQKALLFHRINGYLIIVLILIGNVGALMVARHAFGGDLSTQAAVGVLVIITTLGFACAIYNIKMLQIEQHRAWMLRTMLYLGTIITTRLIMIISAQIISKIGSYKGLMTCGELLSIQSIEYVYETYPLCATINSTERSVLDSVSVAVISNFGNNVEQIGVSLRLPFGMALWMALFIHGVGVEIYLALTPREAQRLRLVSYERQVEAGFKNPGSAGLVIERFGDANPWQKE